ncbi:MAG: hypothetical protein ABSF34_12915, partial [Verrucomicrobiota bacterium]
VCKRGSWNWNCPLKNEPHPNNPVLPANPHFHQITFGTPSFRRFKQFKPFKPFKVPLKAIREIL